MSKLIDFLTIAMCTALLGTLFNVLEVMYPDKIYKGRPDYVHITLYVDRYFDEEEVETIVAAALEWSEATNHIIEYDVIQLPTEDEIIMDTAVFIVKTSPDDPRIVMLDKISSSFTLGLYEGNGLPSIALVTDRLDKHNYKEVILHELGHSLGLEHLKGEENINALMYPYTEIKIGEDEFIPAGSQTITRSDLVAFCKLYHCDVQNLKD